MRVKTGTYTGDGTGSRAITGLGFTPVCVFAVKSGSEVYWKSPMSGANTLSLTNGLLADRITSLDSDGFTVGTSGNASGSSYFWIALGADATVFFQSSYVGTGSAHSITGIGFQPDLVVSADSSGSTSNAFGKMGKSVV